MKKIISIFVFAAMLIFINACNQTNNNQETQTNESENIAVYLSVDDVIAKDDSLANKTIHVEGIIVHICKHGNKRFKIIDEQGSQELKIELNGKFSPVDISIIGEKVKVTGKLVPVLMNEKMILEWKKKFIENHKGEENTEHFKEEMAHIESIYKQITNGEILYYTVYSVEAESYKIQ